MTVLGIDASNIRSGGGVTHLVELLNAVNPDEYDFERIVVWASRTTLRRLEEKQWLIKREAPELEGSYQARLLWQAKRLGPLAKEENCGILFVPGGTFVTRFRPVVTMSRNLLPFSWREMLRYGVSMTAARLLGLRFSQSRSFKNAQGMLFLTQYAKEVVLKATGALPGRTAIVPHGIDKRFFMAPQPQRSIEKYSNESPFRLLYVSSVSVYKHQWHVAEAVARLRLEGFPVSLDLIGPKQPAPLKRLQRTLQRLDPRQVFIRYVGERPYSELQNFYASADLNVFASSCENMPNILLEAMAAGLPTACSNRGPMPEVLGDAGVYFNPEDPNSIANSIRQLLISAELRTELAQRGFERARQYSWERCAKETFTFLAQVASSSYLSQDGKN